MCGIIAAISDAPVVNVILEGLTRMEYRGYDSSGLGLISNVDENGKSKLMVEKRIGKVKALIDACSKDSMSTQTLGMGHTRWATHGAPSDINSHPHSSMDGNLAIVHNGIIENYASLKSKLQAEGYKFKSETDSEVLAHLIRYVQKIEPNVTLGEAVSLALSQVRGAYGICVIDSLNPNVLIGARRGSPLILGVSDNGILLASDASAIVGHTSQVVYLHDDDIVVCLRDPSFEEKGVPKGYKYEIKSLTNEFNQIHSSKNANSFTESESELDQSNEYAGGGKRQKLTSLNKSIIRSKSSYIPQEVFRKINELEMSLEKIEKGGYSHFMLKEIMEQPAVLRDCMRGRIDPITGNITLGGLHQHLEQIASCKRIIICACGTSWHSGLVGEYLIETLAKIPVEVEYASEFRYRNPIILPDDVIIFISQSGETADTLEAVRLCKSKGALAIGIVNVVGSSIARATDAGCYLHIGPEIGVASTKAFTGQVMMLTMIALKLAAVKGLIDEDRQKECGDALLSIPSLIQETLSEENCRKIEETSRSYKYAQNFLYLGRGFNFPVALEGALELKEISYIHASGYPAAEMKHGPIALIDHLMPVVIIAPRFDATYEKVKSGIEEVVARKGAVIAITDIGNNELNKHADVVIHIPVTEEFLSPLLAVIPLQLLAYHIAKLRGCNVDQPRNLAK